MSSTEGNGRRPILRRLVEVLDTDVLVWERDQAIPAPKTHESVAVSVARGEPAGWVSELDRSRRRTARCFLSRGDEAYLARAAGEFAGWVWSSRVTHRDRWSGLRIRLAPDEAYTYALWVDARYRPLGIGPALMAAVLSDIQADPAITRAYGWVDRRNRESQLLLRMVFGFRHAQSVRRIQVLRTGCQLPRSDVPPFGPLSRSGYHSGTDSAQRIPDAARDLRA
jgi:ribosomal protein S18 acetylase RimI-like enzyme